MYGVWLGCRVAGFRRFGRGLGSEGLTCAMTAKLTQRVHVAIWPKGSKVPIIMVQSMVSVVVISLMVWVSIPHMGT